MFRIMFASLIIITGCATKTITPEHHLLPRLTEPDRSNFLVMCTLQGRLPITACICFEEVLMKTHNGDAKKITQLDMAVAQQQCMKTLEPIMNKELEETMRKALEDERKESI